MAKITAILYMKELNHRESAHAHLTERLPLPDYYGRNLDALHDCLTEMDDAELVVLDTEQADGYGEKVLQVLMDSALENPGIRLHLTTPLVTGDLTDEF